MTVIESESTSFHFKGKAKETKFHFNSHFVKSCLELIIEMMKNYFFVGIAKISMRKKGTIKAIAELKSFTFSLS